jgi:hypothetical protein
VGEFAAQRRTQEALVPDVRWAFISNSDARGKTQWDKVTDSEATESEATKSEATESEATESEAPS